MQLSILDTLDGPGALGALDPKEALRARRLSAVIKTLPAKDRLMVARELRSCPNPPATLEGLEGWWADVKKKTGKALKKVGAAKILAAATAGIPGVGPILAPLALKAVSAAEKKAKGDHKGAAQDQAEMRQAAQNAAAGVQEVLPAPGDMNPAPGAGGGILGNKTLLIGAAVAVAAFMFMRRR